MTLPGRGVTPVTATVAETPPLFSASSDLAVVVRTVVAADEAGVLVADRVVAAAVLTAASTPREWVLGEMILWKV